MAIPSYQDEMDVSW